jgi:hypothetical protein
MKKVLIIIEIEKDLNHRGQDHNKNLKIKKVNFQTQTFLKIRFIFQLQYFLIIKLLIINSFL